MSLFPVNELGQLFRLLPEYDVHRPTRLHDNHTLRSFQPKFDVRETKEAYELHGELPGIAQKDVTIEFSDAQTLVVKGRVEREYHSESPGQGRITGEVHDQNKTHRATVEDEGAENKQQQEGQQQQEVTKHKEKGQQHEKVRYWVSERSVGEFHRSFSFPTRVDQDKVKASLKDGILHITLPKAPAYHAKRITIE
jgi:HSP20 family molecular chaperone IbpA